MKTLWNTRHSAHFWSGWLLLAACVSITAFMSIRRPKSKEVGLVHNFFQGARGEKGQWTERLPRGEYTLTCESSEGDDNVLKLIGVEAKYIENPMARNPAQRVLVWHINAPIATREARGTVDILEGPLFIQVKDINGVLLGSGKSDHEGPALRRENDVWSGLAPLRWTQLDESGKGEYFLPAGWRKENDDRFVAERGPVVWNSTGADIVRELTADSLSANDLTTGVLNNVKATMAESGASGGGQIWADRVEVEGATLRFPAPLKFEHQHGWRGTAAEGFAVRPGTGTSDSQGSLELKDFMASGLLNAASTSGNSHRVNVRQVRANGTRWTNAGMQMEGNVQWDLDVNEKNGGSTRYLLRAPRTLYRSDQGDDLPEDIAVGSIRSEGHPVLTWNNNSLSAPKMTYIAPEQSWRLEGPVYGTVPGGSFTAGLAFGSTSSWVFNGPIRADYRIWGTLRGDRLVWSENPEFIYTFTGHPAVLIGLDRRLSGEKIIHTSNQLQFPSGIQGNFNFNGETFSVKADKAEIIGDENIGSGRSVTSIKELRLSGRVECVGQNYNFSSREARITLDNNRLRRITATGGVSLYGSLGSGFGDDFELIFEEGKNQPIVNWSGRVRGRIEVPLER